MPLKGTWRKLGFLIKIRNEHPSCKQTRGPVLMMVWFILFPELEPRLLVVSRVCLILRVWCIADCWRVLVMVVSGRSVDLREGGFIVVCIAIAGRVGMRWEKTIWREWHLFWWRRGLPWRIMERVCIGSMDSHLIICNCPDRGEVIAALDTGSMVHHRRWVFGHGEIEHGFSMSICSGQGNMVGLEAWYWDCCLSEWLWSGKWRCCLIMVRGCSRVWWRLYWFLICIYRRRRRSRNWSCSWHIANSRYSRSHRRSSSWRPRRRYRSYRRPANNCWWHSRSRYSPQKQW